MANRQPDQSINVAIVELKVGLQEPLVHIHHLLGYLFSYPTKLVAGGQIRRIGELGYVLYIFDPFPLIEKQKVLGTE